MPAVDVWRPTAIFAAIVEVQHRRDRVHAQAVHMELAQPERSRGKEKALHLAAAIVEHTRSPALVLALIGVGVFVAGRAVKVDEAVRVLAEVRRQPV